QDCSDHTAIDPSAFGETLSFGGTTGTFFSDAFSQYGAFIPPLSSQPSFQQQQQQQQQPQPQSK
ncbi:hypothetical protein BGW38_009826, partial [Lunasporangiospora selenospora]